MHAYLMFAQKENEKETDKARLIAIYILLILRCENIEIIFTLRLIYKRFRKIIMAIFIFSSKLHLMNFLTKEIFLS